MLLRELILGTVGLISAPIAARAQQRAMPVVGFLYYISPPPNLADLARGPLVQELSEAGFVEGQNAVFERRCAENHYDRLAALAADLVSRKVDVIVASGTLRHWRRETQPRRPQSSSRASATRSEPDSSPVSPGRAATSPASAASPPS